MEVFGEHIIKEEGDYIISNGFAREIDFEIKVKIGKFDHAWYSYALKYIIDYVTREKAQILPGQTIAFNCWIIKFIKVSDDYLELYELDGNGEDFVLGVDLSLSMFSELSSTCEKYSSEVAYPIITQKIVISEGIETEYPIEGVRYDVDGKMSGWWITTDLYNGDISSLKQIEFHQLYLVRPELIKYLALSTGFRFFLEETKDDVWFDQEVLNQLNQ